MVEHALHLAIDLLAVGEGHLHVELRKFRLPIGPQVLIAKAPRDLIILVKARDHRDLLQDLRALRQSKELACVNPRRDDKIARALGRRLEQDRRLDLDKAAVVKIFADRRHGFRPHANVVLQLRPAQVEIAIFKPRVFVRQILGAGDLELEWRHLRVVQDQDLVGVDLDIAGRELSVVRALALDDLAFDRDDDIRRECSWPLRAHRRVSSLRTTWVTPSRSRRSMNVSGPKSRFFATQPISTTCRPLVLSRSSPHECVRSRSPKTSSIKRKTPFPDETDETSPNITSSPHILFRQLKWRSSKNKTEQNNTGSALRTANYRVGRESRRGPAGSRRHLLCPHRV